MNANEALRSQWKMKKLAVIAIATILSACTVQPPKSSGTADTYSPPPEPAHKNASETPKPVEAPVSAPAKIVKSKPTAPTKPTVAKARAPAVTVAKVEKAPIVSPKVKAKAETPPDSPAVSPEVEPPTSQGLDDLSQSMSTLKLRSLDDLPLSLPNGWMLQFAAMPLTTDKTCVLHNTVEGVFDGYENTAVEAWLTPQEFLVKSRSNFDLSYPDSGVVIMDAANVELDRLVLSATASESVVRADFLLSRYTGSASLGVVVKTGFWPTWPVTETRVVTFPVSNVGSMLSTMRDCARLLQ